MARSSGGAAARRTKQPPRRKRRGAGLITFMAIMAVWTGIAACGFIIYASRDLPDLSGLTDFDRQPSIVFLDRNGALIGRRGDQQGRAMRLHELPETLPRAVLAVEDRKFYYHPGIDPFGIARAAIANLRAGAVVQGGSTITQQLAKNLFLTNEQTFKRKSQEVVLALWLERRFTKDEILELYLNRVYFGSGAWGVEAASRRFFGKSAAELSLGESALLAGLLKAPSRYNPASDVNRAEGRATVVLDVMVESGQITHEEREAAFNTPIVVTRRAAASSAYFFMDWLDVQLAEILGRVDRDIVVETTLDLGLQRAAETALRTRLDEAAIEAGASEGAAVALDPQGGVLTMAGGRSYDQSQFNRAAQARRQPGSAFKSFVYLAAVERGLTPATVRLDAQTRVGDYSPRNYNNRYEGEITLRRAFEQSSNSVALRLAQEAGFNTVAATARRLGVTSPMRNEAAIALGAQEVTVLELATAYAPFANGGMGVFPHGVTLIRTPQGEILYERRGSGPGRAIEPHHLAVMQDLMRGVTIRGTGRRAAIEGRDVGGKTGTTDNFRDAWFAGFSEGVSAVVWVGNDAFRPMTDITGGTLPAEIWSDFIAAAPRFDIAPPPPTPASMIIGRSDDGAWTAPEGDWITPDSDAPPMGLPQAEAPPPAAATPAERRQATRDDDPLGALIARVAE